MQYLMSVIHDQASLATPEEHAAIGVFNDRLQSEGHWVFAGDQAPDLDVALKLAAAASKACCTTTLHLSLSALSTTTSSG